MAAAGIQAIFCAGTETNLDGSLSETVSKDRHDEASLRAERTGFEPSPMEILAERILCLMDIAPYPGRRRDGAHHGMLRLMKMLGCVLAGGGIATADVAARLALAKRNPNSSLG